MHTLVLDSIAWHSSHQAILFRFLIKPILFFVSFLLVLTAFDSNQTNVLALLWGEFIFYRHESETVRTLEWKRLNKTCDFRLSPGKNLSNSNHLTQLISPNSRKITDFTLSYLVTVCRKVCRNIFFLIYLNC